MAVNLKINLDSAAVTDGVEQTVESLESLKESLQSDSQELRAMQGALTNLKRGLVVDKDAVSELKKQIDLQRQSVAQTQLTLIKAGVGFKRDAKQQKATADQLKDTGKEVDSLAAKYAKLTKSEAKASAGAADEQSVVDGMGGSLGGLVTKASRALKLTRTGVGAVALGITAAALGVTAAAAATKQVFDRALAASQSRQDELFKLQSTALMSRRGAGAGADIQAAIDKIAPQVSASREELVEFADTLYKGGIRGKELATALKTVATVSDVHGKAAADSFVKVELGAGRSKASVDRLAKVIEKRLGGTAAAKFASLNVQSRKFGETVDSMFKNIKLDKLEHAAAGWTAIFSDKTPSGRFMKQFAEGFGQALIDGFASISVIGQNTLLDILILSQELEIAWLKLRLLWKQTFTLETPKTKLDKTFVKDIKTANELVKKHGFLPQDTRAGYFLPEGVVNGITKGLPEIESAAEAAGRAANEAFKKATDQHSPSRLWAEYGKNLIDGLNVGIDGALPDLEKRMQQISAKLTPGGVSVTASGAAGTGAASKPSAVDVIQHNTISITVPTDGTSVQPDKFRELSANLFGELAKALKRAGSGQVYVSPQR